MDQFEKAVFTGQPRPRSRKCFCAKRRVPVFFRLAQPLSKEHDLVSGTWDFSTHLPLDWCLFTQHKCTTSLFFCIFPPCLLCRTYIYLSVFPLNAPGMIHSRSYAFAVAFVWEVSFPGYSDNPFGLYENNTFQRSLWLSYIKITHCYYFLHDATTFFYSYQCWLNARY